MNRPSSAHAAHLHKHGLILAALMLLLGGCATLGDDGGFSPLRQTATDRLGMEVQVARSEAEVNQIGQRVAEMLTQPLSAAAAVQITLLNHRGLQAAFQELGIAEADLVQASRLPNPGFSIGRLKRGDEQEIERSVSLDLGHLLLLPLARAAETRRFAAVQQRVAMEMLALAASARKAYYGAVAAEQSLRVMQQAQRAADAGAELARRMAQVGNFNKLQQAREQGFSADAALNLARARQLQLATRERVIRLLGLWGAQTGFTLPERLPELPSEPADRPDIEQAALAQRLDVQAAKLQTEASAKNLGLSRVTGFVNVLELGYAHNSSNQAPRQTGYEVSFEIPLFDWSGARVAKAQAVYMRSVHQAAQAAIEARSEVREAYHGYRSAYDIARHYRDHMVPSAKRISDENLLRYNGMLIGVFELLADTRAQIATVDASIAALRDFWIAHADLEMALVGKPSLPPAAPAAMAAGGTAEAAH